MGALGYIIALILAAVLAGGAQYLIDRKYLVGRSIYLFILAFVGLFVGSRLIPEFGNYNTYLSFIGPSTDGFYYLTGLIGGLLLVGVVTLTMKRQAQGMPTDVASEGISDPRVAHFLFSDARSAPVWLLIRIYVGYEWLSAGFAKMTEKGWMDGGSALQGSWKSSIVVPQTGSPKIRYDWYREFISYMLNHQWYTWFGKLVAVGEFLVGLGLIVGCLVGFAAFFGALMNFNFMLLGSASTNPVMFGLAVALILAWKVAGYWGIDRVLLPMLGAPWSPGKAFKPVVASTRTGTPSRA